jgi:hypothetical protein
MNKKNCSNCSSGLYLSEDKIICIRNLKYRCKIYKVYSLDDNSIYRYRYEYGYKYWNSKKEFITTEEMSI